MIKVMIILFVFGWICLLLLVIGETYAMENKHPRFTKWWRKQIISDIDYEKNTNNTSRRS